MRPLSTLLAAVFIWCRMALTISLGADVARPLPVPHVTSEPPVAIASPFAGSNSPIIAVWQDSPGLTSDTNYPYLRMAVWSDGRVVFARDPNVWNNDLLIGQLSAQEIAKLEREIRRTGVFDLKGYCYLVPDASVDCVLLSFGGSQQMMYWDEVESPSYGINVNPKPRHVAFKKAWWDVNRLALSALPTQATMLKDRFKGPPRAWYLKKTIQSE